MTQSSCKRDTKSKSHVQTRNNIMAHFFFTHNCFSSALKLCFQLQMAGNKLNYIVQLKKLRLNYYYPKICKHFRKIKLVLKSMVCNLVKI